LAPNTQLLRRVELSLRSGYRALAELIEHGWIVRHETSHRDKVAGLLCVGRDCDRAVVAVCQGPGCTTPLANKRQTASPKPRPGRNTPTAQPGR
jgi:hypothetical protein